MQFCPQFILNQNGNQSLKLNRIPDNISLRVAFICEMGVMHSGTKTQLKEALREHCTQLIDVCLKYEEISLKKRERILITLYFV